MMYFDQYRGIASGIIFAGFSLSSLIFARVLVIMQEVYGFRSIFFLCGAIMMNGTALVIPLKEPQWKKPKDIFYKNQECPQISWIDTNIKQQSSFPHRHSFSEPPSSFKHVTARKSMRLFRKPLFYVIIVYSVLGDYTRLTFQTTIVDYVMDKGFSLTASESLVIYYSITELLGRVVISIIADRNVVNRSTLVAINLFMLACAVLLLPHVSSFSCVHVACLCTAMFSAFITSMKSVLMADYLGVDAISPCWAIVGLACLPLWCCNSMIIGKWLRLFYCEQALC